MSSLTKLTVLVLIIVSIFFAMRLVLNQATVEETVTELPVGSPNVPRENGLIVPTDIGFDTGLVQPLDTILPSEPTFQFASVLNNVHLDNYAVFPCHIDDGKTNVMMLTKKFQLDGEFNTTRVADEAVAAWEPYVVHDLGNLIFPNETMLAAPPLANFNLVGSEGIRRAPLAFANNDGGYIYGSERSNYVFYGASMQCVKSAMDLVYVLD